MRVESLAALRERPTPVWPIWHGFVQNATKSKEFPSRSEYEHGP